MKKIAVFLGIGLSLIFLGISPAAARNYYKTYNVVAVTEKNFVLQKKGGEKVEIEISRRPEVRVGDKIRYDKRRNRLGETVEEE